MANLDQKQLLHVLSDIAWCGSQRDYDALIGAVNALWSWGIISTKLYERVHSLDRLIYENREFNWMTDQEDDSWFSEWAKDVFEDLDKLNIRKEENGNEEQ